MSKLSIIVPVYWNSDTLMLLYEDMKEKILHKLEDYEIVFVDDGSGDNSWEIMNQIRDMDDKVRLVKLSRNFGEHSAILAGLSVCTGDCAVTKQADLQEDSELILQLYEKWKEGNKVVLAVRADRDEGAIQKFFANLSDIKRTEDEVTVSYTLHNTNWTTYRINQVSVLFFDKPYGDSDAKLLAYEKIEGQQFSNKYDYGIYVDQSREKSFTVPEGLRDKQCGRDYHAYLIAEQVNGEHESNFASAPVEITIPKGSYQIVHTVVNPQGEEVTYDAQNPIDVTGFFTLDSRLAPYKDKVTMTYELLTGEGVTGTGTLDENQKLTVTKCGTFKVKVTTSAVSDDAGDPLYSEGEAVATLTVKKAAGSMGDVTVANTDSAKTDIIYGDTWTASTSSTTNQDVSYTYWLNSQSEEQATATLPTAAGTYTVKATYAATDLYEACSKTAEFTILPRPAALQWSETKLTYKGDAQSVTATVTNKVSPDTDDSFKLEYVGNTETEAGNYTARVTALGMRVHRRKKATHGR